MDLPSRAGNAVRLLFHNIKINQAQRRRVKDGHPGIRTHPQTPRGR